MRRLEELMGKYPQISGSVILKTDLVREGNGENFRDKTKDRKYLKGGM